MSLSIITLTSPVCAPPSSEFTDCAPIWKCLTDFLGMSGAKKINGGHITASVLSKSIATRFVLSVIFLASDNVPGFIFQLPMMSFLFMKKMLVNRCYCINTIFTLSDLRLRSNAVYPNDPVGSSAVANYHYYRYCCPMDQSMMDLSGRLMLTVVQ